MDLPPLPDPGFQQLLLGFSGGRDSTVLLHRLAALRAERGWGLRAVHVDHGLHPDSAAWADRALAAAAALAVPCSVRRVTVQPGRHGPEAAARRARMAALAAERRPDEVLVLAQHADDQVETVLLALLRGRDRGLAGMRPWTVDARGPVWRPLLGIDGAAVAAYAAAHRLDWIEDPANRDPRFDRNALRHTLVPEIRARFPQAPAAILALAGRQAAAQRMLDAQAEADLAGLLDASGATLDAAGLRALGEDRGGLALRHWAAAQGGRLSVAALRRVFGEWAALPATRATRHAQGGHWLRQWDGRLWWTPRPAAPIDPLLPMPPWDGRQPLELGAGGRLRLLGAEALPEALLPRRRGEGDWRLAVDGATAGERPLAEWLAHWRLPPWQRGVVPVLVDHRGAAQAVADLGSTPSFARWLRERGARLSWQPGPGLG